MKNILLTCPPMIKQFDKFSKRFNELKWNVHVPEFTQIMPESELIKIIGNYDGVIAGDDPYSRKVLENGKKLRGLVKWGIGIDAIDTVACSDLKIKFDNTPGMFGDEVADMCICYVIGLARDLFFVNENVKNGNWIKPTGMSLRDKKICVIGFGNIGQNICKRLLSFGMNVFVYDPGYDCDFSGNITCNFNKNVNVSEFNTKIKVTNLSACLENSDFVVVACSLTNENVHLVDKEKLLKCNYGVRLINVSRGKLVNENDLCDLLESGHVYGYASDVFENEPLSVNSKLLSYDKNIFGSHNGSNTIEAVLRTSFIAINKLNEFLN